MTFTLYAPVVVDVSISCVRAVAPFKSESLVFTRDALSTEGLLVVTLNVTLPEKLSTLVREMLSTPGAVTLK